MLASELAADRTHHLTTQLQRRGTAWRKETVR
ncbi:unnamed protein product [Tetraodon nigroviridis]|uniref:(spotted green pufferfish) hypothetical protein n=1 Tax=Tetraodon nigroviridis TaxID=99883 RepID=Q4SI66_TETNG|nr:unnamed protein product [Tetraodon nigroviridis]